MMKVEKNITIDAPVEQVFAYLCDPTHTPEYSTGTDEVKDVQRLPNGGYRYTTVDKFLGMRSETINEDIEVVPNELSVSKFHSALVDGTASMRLERLADGKTRVTIAGEANLRGGALAKFGEAFFARYMDHGMEMGMEAAKARIEMEAQAATPS